ADGARGDCHEAAGRREGLRAPGRTGDPRHRQAGRDRRRPGRARLARDRARHRGRARVPRPDQGDGDPGVARGRVREVSSTVAAERRLYRELASWFHLLTSPADYEEEAALYRRLLVECADGPVESVLELGSGG